MLINNDLRPNILTDLMDLFFPQTCLNCGSLVQIDSSCLCLGCLSELPLTYFSNYSGNCAEKTFTGRLPIQSGTSLLFYDKKSMVQKILQQLKYGGKPEIGIFFGHWLAAEMKYSGRFETLTTVIPVPLHPRKQRRRGYNQVHLFARTIAAELGIDYLTDHLIKLTNDRTQTQKSRLERLLKGENDYKVKCEEALFGKHILLVDDVITSGGTMESCALPLLKLQGVKVSAASLAFTA